MTTLFEAVAGGIIGGIIGAFVVWFAIMLGSHYWFKFERWRYKKKMAKAIDGEEWCKRMKEEERWQTIGCS